MLVTRNWEEMQRQIKGGCLQSVYDENMVNYHTQLTCKLSMY